MKGIVFFAVPRSPFVWAQGKEASQEWKYKVVEFSEVMRSLRARKPLPLEENKHGSDGWDLVSYSQNDNVGVEAIAVYRKQVKP